MGFEELQVNNNHESEQANKVEAPRRETVLERELESTFLENREVGGTRLRERLEDKIFSKLVCDDLFDTLDDELFDAGYEGYEVMELQSELAKLGLEDRKKVLSFPSEVRGRLLASYKEKMDAGMTSAEMIESLRETSDKYGFTVGFHLSNADIEQKQDDTWDIEGYEFDDRDEMPMAYYSLDYQNRYRKKASKFLYLVRAETGEKTAHKRDLSNNWGRANKLSVIDKMDILDLQSRTEARYQEYTEKKKQERETK